MLWALILLPVAAYAAAVAFGLFLLFTDRGEFNG
jgi:hypothetical protein